MADKSKELECLEKVLNCKTVKGQFARDVREALLLRKRNPLVVAVKGLIS